MKPLAGGIAVLGCGVTGVAVARFVLVRKTAGDPVTVAVFDERDGAPQQRNAEELREAGARVELGVTALDARFDLCVASPGIPPESPLVYSARENAHEIVSEIEFAYTRSRSPWLAVTGTNGKTTVTSLCAHILRYAGMPAECVGNIGDPAISVAEVAGPSSAIVAEVSSFQLALTQTFHPRVAVLLNITADHLDWHGSMEEYRAAKALMFENMVAGDTAVIDIDDEIAAGYAPEVEKQGVRVVRVSRSGVLPGGAGLDDGWLALDVDGETHRVLPAEELHLRGDHNVSNALAALAATHAFGVPLETIGSALGEFLPIAHRLEPVGVVDDVEYINDSKATNPGATIMALTAFRDRPIVLLVGGRNKDNDFGELLPHLSGVRAVVAFGESAEEIAEALGDGPVPVYRADTMVDAVDRARDIVEPGDVVLLAPACASFDEFAGYAERGRVFAQKVSQYQGVTA